MSSVENNNSNCDKLAIDVPSLNFSYGGPPILTNLRLQLKKGSRCLLVGANGAGKSTLLTILAGKRMVRGKVSVFGKDAFKDAPQGVTYLGTEWANNPVIRGDILVSTLISNMNGNKYPERRDELIEIMDVNPKWRMHQVSDGQRRRVQFVLGLLEPWDLLLMDEVTVDSDVLVRTDLLNYLKKETETRGATIVHATHIFDGLGDWPTHIAHIKRGTIVAFHDFNQFPELDKMIHQQLQLRSYYNKVEDGTNQQLSPQLISYFRKNMDSPLLSVIEQWLREDFRELRLLQDEERKKAEQEQDKVLLGEEVPRTKWDDLSENVKVHGDKYYNYWNN
ncbi:P-loop containing nucleoside triphosphate hydrolase protein [Gigaspora margarita]|uniref:P-loop containing nucleoside triphosphate hydrolase protein n=2 Tax=Gigaspora margarita TaxID=4874 RepID=A0A8H4AG96_GIGMA|nr:P-loop containing nucleoside triphosphate hydrolase protein [Gigaspora margarita]